MKPLRKQGLFYVIGPPSLRGRNQNLSENTADLSLYETGNDNLKQEIDANYKQVKTGIQLFYAPYSA